MTKKILKIYLTLVIWIKMNYSVMKRKKMVSRLELETPKNIGIDEYICFRSKVFSLKCKNDDESKNKLEGVSQSQSKHIKFEDCEKDLDGKDY